MLVLMADIFPTGYFAAQRFLKGLNDRDRKEYTAVCIGCGPVGVCAITCALTMYVHLPTKSRGLASSATSSVSSTS